ncbi:MAG: aminopeptidase [Gammaproteobacteria bacterium]
MRNLLRILAVLFVALLSACSTLGYYGQAIHGELGLLSERRPISQIVADPKTSAVLREKLELAEQIRRFASEQLDLPQNGSYTTYVALDRPYVSWNVFATKPFSLTPITWCFLFAGCVPYRGYFHQQSAQSFADNLRQQGDDVYVSGVPAFSTLGWFDDPLLSSMLDWNDATLANYIFHELAHQKLYVKGDADFNESWAVTVADMGVRRWLQASGREAQLAEYESRQQHWHMIVSLVDTTRTQLQQLYSSGLPEKVMRKHKQEIFDSLRSNYASLRPQLGNDTGYDSFFKGPINNASLLVISTYTRWTPAFRALLLENNGDLPSFYQAVKQLAQLPTDQRNAALEKLMAKSAGSGNG